MLLNIQPLHIDGLDCREDVFFSVAAHYRGEYRLAFSEVFNFEYLSVESGQTELMCNRIGTGVNKQDLLEKYYKFKILTVKAGTVEEVISTIKEQLQFGYPTAISINTYWCPWHRNYQRVSLGHTCLAVAIDADNNITCIDPVEEKGHAILPYEDFKNGFAYYSTFHFENPPQSFDFKAIFSDSVKKIGQSNIFENMGNFIEDFAANFNFEDEFKTGRPDVWGSLFFRKLIYISGSRLLYSQFINYVNKDLQNPKLNQIENDLLNVYSKWRVAISWLLKGLHSGYSPKIHDKTVKIFEDILKEERSLFGKLQEAIVSNTLLSQEDEKIKNPELEVLCEDTAYTYVDLKNFCNNIAFHSTCSKDSAADYTGTGHYFLSQEAPSEQIISLDKMLFKFPVIRDNTCDNVSCNNQVISVPSNEYKGILLMGSSEWGSFIEHLKLNYNDGREETLQITFSDWAAQKPIYDDKFIWGGKVYNKYEGRVYHGEYSLFALLRPIPRDKTLVSITLPECSNMHIFAITLCK